MKTQTVGETNARNADIKTWIQTIQSESVRNYLEVRVIPQMEYYSKSSRKNKKQYLKLRTLTIVFSALIPIATLFSEYGMAGKLVIMILGALVSAITLYLELQNYDMLWRAYRVKREQLLGTLMCYFMNAGEFAVVSDQNRKDTMLVEICEQCMSEEHKIWQGIIDTKKNLHKKGAAESEDE